MLGIGDFLPRLPNHCRVDHRDPAEEIGSQYHASAGRRLDDRDSRG
jgi:hypothetical protein